eukprot:s1548_g2.t1
MMSIAVSRDGSVLEEFLAGRVFNQGMEYLKFCKEWKPDRSRATGRETERYLRLAISCAVSVKLDRSVISWISSTGRIRRFLFLGTANAMRARMPADARARSFTLFFGPWLELEGSPMRTAMNW